MNEKLYNQLWNAFCTIHWFVTGERDLYKSESARTHSLYLWYFNLENSVFDKLGD